MLLAGTIPVLTFVVERWVTRRYIDPGPGRVAPAQPGRAGGAVVQPGERAVLRRASPSAAHRPGTVHVLLPDVHLELGTDAGVFSPRRLDPGTRLLLDVAPPPPPSGNLLDLGCGYGPLALVLAARVASARRSGRSTSTPGRWR